MAGVLCQPSKSWQRTLPEVLAFRSIRLDEPGLRKRGFWGDRELAKSFPGVENPKLRKTLANDTDSTAYAWLVDINDQADCAESAVFTIRCPIGADGDA